MLKIKRAFGLINLAHLWLALFLCLFPVPALAQGKRVALVIGNGNYDNLLNLDNPRRDAEAISQSLSALGYTVFLTTELTQEKFRNAIRFFLSRAKDADSTLFYFAGHGATIAGTSYLFPIDFGKDDFFDIQEAIVLDDILNELGSKLQTNLVFIDACRNNPVQSGAVAINSQFASRQGLRTRPKIGTLISFATTPGSVAYDGEGVHSPFTGALLDHLATPGIDVELMLKRVRRDVVVNSQGQQVPWTESSLLSSFQMVPQKMDLANKGIARNPAPNTPMLSVLANTGFSQKPILQRISTGLSANAFEPNILKSLQLEKQRSVRIKALLCSVLEPPLPASCADIPPNGF